MVALPQVQAAQLAVLDPFQLALGRIDQLAAKYARRENKHIPKEKSENSSLKEIGWLEFTSIFGMIS